MEGKSYNVKIPHLTLKYNLIIPDHVQLTCTALTSQKDQQKLVDINSQGVKVFTHILGVTTLLNQDIQENKLININARTPIQRPEF